MKIGESRITMKQFKFVTMLVSLFLLAACSSLTPESSTGNNDQDGEIVAVEGGEYIDVSVDVFEMMLENKDFTFVNVHIPFEGNIPDTDLSIPFDQIGSNLDQLPADKDAKIVLYCRSGSMSSTAAKTLVQSGYTNVWNLDGGFNAWQRAGLPLEDLP